MVPWLGPGCRSQAQSGGRVARERGQPGSLLEDRLPSHSADRLFQAGSLAKGLHPPGTPPVIPPAGQVSDAARPITQILVVGAPRSGTTWTAHALSRATGATGVMEPDNTDADAYARIATRNLQRYPVLAPDADLPQYEVLWRLALAGGWPPLGGVWQARRLLPRLPAPIRFIIGDRLARGALWQQRRRPRHQSVVVKSVR